MDAAGIDRLVVSDHVVFGENLAAYADSSKGGQTGGRQPTGPDGAWLEPITVLAALTAATTQIRLGTCVLLAALRRPAVLAKQLATLDVISGGRIDIGVGVGWQREEYEAAGLPFDGRGRLLDHTLEVCRLLWTRSAPPTGLANSSSTPFTRCRNRFSGAVFRYGSVEPSINRSHVESRGSAADGYRGVQQSENL